MPVVNDGLEHELGYIENPDEQRHIRALWDTADPLMQQISHCLIQGKNNDVDHLTRQALDDGFSANTIMDDGLIAGMAVVGIKFRDNIIFVPEVTGCGPGDEGRHGLHRTDLVRVGGRAHRHRGDGYGERGTCTTSAKTCVL